MKSKIKTTSLVKLDARLLADFKGRFSPAFFAKGWRDKTLFRRRAELNDGAGLSRLRRELESEGLFDVRCERVVWRDQDKETRSFTLARAASTDMWPMGTHYWVRDNALLGARFLFSDSHRHHRVGKELLLSALTFMSSVSQLQRVTAMIRSRSSTYVSNADNWPYIFAEVSTNLTARKREGWAHKQDAWQILTWYVLEGIEKGFITRHDLSVKHRKFLSLIIPFLIKISFWKCESSGSWEELAAVRTSVRAWEHRLLVRLAEISKRHGFSFIEDGFMSHRRYLPARFKSMTLAKAVQAAETRAVEAIGRDLPFESPRYRRNDPRYRKADAALIYLLQLDYPSFLAERAGRPVHWARSIEARILKELSSLEDELIGGIARYSNDSYQRQGFFRPSTVAKLNKLYGTPSGDASTHFVERGRIVPKGRKAAWTHFVWQLAAWYGRRYLESGDRKDRAAHDRYFLRGMALITGKGEVSIDIGVSGESRVLSIPRYRMPECYISEKLSGGQVAVFPSPHTPLNWAVGEMFDAFQVRERILANSR